MKRRRLVMAVSVLLGMAALGLWLGWIRPAPTPLSAALRHVPNGKPSVLHHFCLTNLSSRTIVILNMSLEVNNGGRWQRYASSYTNSMPEWDLMKVGPRQASYGEAISPPGGVKWRMHLWLGIEAHGIEAVREWISVYLERNTWQRMSQTFGFKIWRWPPFNGTGAVATHFFELISEEID